MKRGKDDEKLMGPMFPRLHVNDTEKGGPRAPPRNKMALYEQLSTPSHRFNHGALPHNTNKASNLVPSASTSQAISMQGSGNERNVFFQHHVPFSTPAPSHVTEIHHSQRPGDGNSNASSSQLEQKKKVGDEDDFTVPVFVHSSMGKTQNSSDRDNSIPFTPNHLVTSTKIKNHNDKRNSSSRATDVGQDSKNDSEVHLEACVSSNEHSVRSSTSFIARDKVSGPGTASLRQQNDLSLANFSRFYKNDVHLLQESTALLQKNDSGCDEGVPQLAREIEERNHLGPITLSNSYSADDLNSHGEPESDNECREKTCRSLQFENGDKSDDVSETSMVDSISTLDITPDDVVGIIGQKSFWKARRAIDYQQRLFAVQVFELHRLIKVQRLIAAAPHLLLENGTYVAKPSPKISSAKKLPAEYVVMPPVHVAKCKDDSDKPTNKREQTAENAVGKTSYSSVKNGSQPPNYGLYFGNPTPVPMATDTSVGPWFHPSPVNQWLVPVMSPSEGLVYKPCAPPGFMGSVCGGCGPHMNSNFINPCYRGPAYHPHSNGVLPGFPPAGQFYFPPYGMPFMTPPISGSAVEQTTHVAGSGSQGHTGQLSGGRANFNTHHQNSCNQSTQKRVPVSRDCELPGSTASSPSERGQGVEDALELFPMAPGTPEGLPQVLETGQPTRVIKVVPHNARSATESAARIFQSIQEERKQNDSI